MEISRLHTVSEVSEILNVSDSVTRRLIKEGKLPAIRIGKVIRIKNEDIKNFLKEHKVVAVNGKLSVPNKCLIR